jgi:hypothetical protein
MTRGRAWLITSHEAGPMPVWMESLLLDSALLSGEESLAAEATPPPGPRWAMSSSSRSSRGASRLGGMGCGRRMISHGDPGGAPPEVAPVPVLAFVGAKVPNGRPFVVERCPRAGPARAASWHGRGLTARATQGEQRTTNTSTTPHHPTPLVVEACSTVVVFFHQLALLLFW